MSDSVCGNCGVPDDELVLVRRVYVVPPSWDTPGSHTVVAEPESWCVSCVSQYPCEFVDDRLADGGGDQLAWSRPCSD